MDKIQHVQSVMNTIPYKAWEILLKHNCTSKQIAQKLEIRNKAAENAMAILIRGGHAARKKVRGQRASLYEPIINNPPPQYCAPRPPDKVTWRYTGFEKPELNFIATMPIINFEERA